MGFALPGCSGCPKPSRRLERLERLADLERLAGLEGLLDRWDADAGPVSEEAMAEARAMFDRFVGDRAVIAR